MMTRQNGSTTFRRLALCTALPLALLAGSCDEVPATQVVVTLDGDPSVLQELKLVQALVYAPDAMDASKPIETSEFRLTSEPGKKRSVQIPFSFGIEKRDKARVKLVVKGYASETPTDLPEIESKVWVDFQPNQTLGIDVYLTDSCYQLLSPCEELDQTCYQKARACGEITAAESEPVVAGDELNQRPPRPPAPGPACPARNMCAWRDYPCALSDSGGYSCQGQLAEWPMPDALPGSKFPPSYDFSSQPGLVLDKVTGLIWQREIPALYEGCSGKNQTAGDSCTWDEAKIYCSQLTLAGRSWRLPSRIELESLIDLTESAPAISRDAFPNTPIDKYWSASPAAFTIGRSDVPMYWWFVELVNGHTGAEAASAQSRVRCVTGGAATADTPAERYVDDISAHTITDTRTKLVWRREVFRSVKTWEAARDQCAALGEGFRLPSLKELLTLVDPTEFAPAIHRSIPNISDKDPTFWSSSRLKGDVVQAGGGVWLVDFFFGGSTDEAMRVRLASIAAPTAPHVRCVR
jgi:hypothetical protein